MIVRRYYKKSYRCDLFIDIIKGSLELLNTDNVAKQQLRGSFSIRFMYYGKFELLVENFGIIIGWRTFAFALFSDLKENGAIQCPESFAEM